LAQKINDNGCLKGTTTQIFFTRRLMVRKGKKRYFHLEHEVTNSGWQISPRGRIAAETRPERGGGGG
jgi:hypothetical protein